MGGKPGPPHLVLVFANWCPHCYPLSTERAPLLAQRLGVPLRLLDIDLPDQEKEADAYVERYELQPIDYQTNGPQLLYGLRYHTHIVKPGEVETFHDQVGYWLWEPAARTVVHTIAIPRAQVVLAAGSAEPDATEFEVGAMLGSETFGILSNPFLARAFQTESFRLRVTVHDNGTWSYEEHTMMRVLGRDGLVNHVDRNTLRRIRGPRPNPLAAAAARSG